MTGTLNCDNCGVETPLDELLQSEEMNICDDCVGEMFPHEGEECGDEQCDVCGEYTDACFEETLPNGDTRTICAACQDDLAKDAHDEMRLGLRRESTNFDKFLDHIVLKEHANKTKIKTLTDSPQRSRAARNQDRPLNKTRFGAK